MAKEKRGQKFGRNKRAATNSQQTYRTAKNKRLHTERAAKVQPKTMNVARGTARAQRRADPDKWKASRPKAKATGTLVVNTYPKAKPPRIAMGKDVVAVLGGMTGYKVVVYDKAPAEPTSKRPALYKRGSYATYGKALEAAGFLH